MRGGRRARDRRGNAEVSSRRPTVAGSRWRRARRRFIPTSTSQFLLNGAPISDKDGNWQLAPNVEAVQEFKVMTNTYDASYGRFGGGVVNTTIKGGSNDFHGDVFDYFRNAVLDANRTENKQTTPNKP